MAIHFEYDIHKDIQFVSHKYLLNMGAKINPKKCYLYQFLLINHKKITPTPRKISFSSKFKIPKKHFQGFINLLLKAQTGGNINPYLSKSLLKGGFEDQFFNDFQIYHLHLGLQYSNSFAERTGDLAFAFITLNEIFFIDVLQHNEDLLWYRQELLRTIHRERPELIQNFRLNNVIPTQIINDEDRKKLRSAHINTPIIIGDCCYMSPGMGITSAGTSGEVSHQQNNVENSIDRDLIYLKDRITTQLSPDTSGVFQINLTDFHGSLYQPNSYFDIQVEGKNIAKAAFTLETDNIRNFRLTPI